MTNWPELYLLRHGQSEWNAEGRIQGGLESRLTELGRRHAAAQRAILDSLDLRGFGGWCSPQVRARQTAEIALAGTLADFTEDGRLREIGLGDWEGRLRDDLAPEFFGDESDETGVFVFDRAPGGEGFAALHARCLSFLTDLSRPAVVVTHGITSRMLRLIALGMDLAELGDLPGGQGVVYHVRDGVHRKLG